MGGKPWSDLEERIFWESIAPRAPPGLDAGGRRGQRPAGGPRSWAPLAKEMKRLMSAAAPNQPPREYNNIGCYEHYYHNHVRTLKKPSATYSPHARPHVMNYRAWLRRNQAANNRSTASNDSNNGFMTRQLQAQASRRQQRFQSHRGQPPTQNMSATGTGNSSQGVTNLNQPTLPVPRLPQAYGNVGNGSFSVPTPNQYPGSTSAQSGRVSGTQGEAVGPPAYSPVQSGGTHRTRGRAAGVSDYSPSQSGNVHRTHRQAAGASAYNPAPSGVTPRIYGYTTYIPRNNSAQYGGRSSSHEQVDDGFNDSDTDYSSEGQLSDDDGATPHAG
ncbi:hypothetical protein VMCG_04627 [Cytospora schulzeri]|uniref:Uncharacterized protein n=1 Tax=Cytospora schulzeri TaxID=448051 RepID=A0A423WRR1_9PEZI|nr:hypothetical protein VMCG_04627 [Valsa malicola]